MKTAATTRVAALQMTSAPDVDTNLHAAAQLLREAAEGGAQIAVLPENFSFMGLHDGDKRIIAERDGDGPVQRFLAEQARSLSLWIVGGTTPISSAAGEPVAAASLVYDARGQRVARFDKMHLFDVDLPGGDERYRESTHIRPGSRPLLVPTPAGLLGLAVCYDMRFPELFRLMSAGGAQWFAVPAAFTVPTGRAHWEVLLRSRAIENLAYVVASAQCGTHANGRSTYGDSLVIDYWGTVQARRPDSPGVVFGTIDLQAQEEARRNFPALRHRVL